MAGSRAATGNRRETVVVKLKSAADRDKIVKTAGGTEASAAGKKYYRTRAGALYFVSDRLLVSTSSDADMLKLLDKGGKVDLSADMQAATNRGRGQIWQAQSGSGVFGAQGGGKGGEMFGLTAPPPPRYMVACTTLSGNMADLRAEFEFNDSDSARKGADAIEKMINFVKAFAVAAPNDAKNKRAKEMFESAKVSTSGTTVTLTMSGQIDGTEDFKFGFGF
jgi:hypothetical protein